MAFLDTVVSAIKNFSLGGVASIGGQVATSQPVQTAVKQNIDNITAVFKDSGIRVLKKSEDPTFFDKVTDTFKPAFNQVLTDFKSSLETATKNESKNVFDKIFGNKKIENASSGIVVPPASGTPLFNTDISQINDFLSRLNSTFSSGVVGFADKQQLPDTVLSPSSSNSGGSVIFIIGAVLVAFLLLKKGRA